MRGLDPTELQVLQFTAGPPGKVTTTPAWDQAVYRLAARGCITLATVSNSSGGIDHHAQMTPLGHLALRTHAVDFRFLIDNPIDS